MADEWQYFFLQISGKIFLLISDMIFFTDKWQNFGKDKTYSVVDTFQWKIFQMDLPQVDVSWFSISHVYHRIGVNNKYSSKVFLVYGFVNLIISGFNDFISWKLAFTTWAWSYQQNLQIYKFLRILTELSNFWKYVPFNIPCKIFRIFLS